MDWIAWGIATLALAFGNGGTPPPDAFTDGMRERGVATVTADFIGMRWACEPTDAYDASGMLEGEECYAGIIRIDGAPSLAVGP